ncbi:MAG: biotin/lipoyl-containing protein [Myxococcota bacterium]
MNAELHLTALVRPDSVDGRLVLLSPTVGLWRSMPAVGALVRPGDAMGAIESLGRLRTLFAPTNAAGIVVQRPDDGRARLPVAYKDELLVLDPQAGGSVEFEGLAADEQRVQGHAFCAPMSGRFYMRPGPDKPPFIAPGQTIRVGDTVCLLEVMKTFNRVTYGGAGLPQEAKIKRVAPADGADLNRGDAIIELEVD